MKFATVASASLALLAASATATAAALDAPHGGIQHAHHRHRARAEKAQRRAEVEKRAVDYVYAYVTVIVDAAGNIISGPGSETSTAAVVESTTSAAPVESTTSAAVVAVAQDTTSSSETSTSTTSSSTYEAPTSTEQTTSSSSTSSSTSVASSTTFSTATTSSSSSSSSSAAEATGTYTVSSDLLADFTGPTEKFVDGTVSCDTFPSGQGVIPVDWIGLGGWSGIQVSTAENSGTASSCGEGNLCSYACQPGMSKTQWPSSQPADGESRGGLTCTNGYLYRTNTDTDYLCVWGVESANVVSNLSESVAICRTDYPGTENMDIPTVVGGGSTVPLTVVDEESYYTWQGKLTSAQYYVNNAGVSEEDGCVWGTSEAGVGNYAPLNFGAGYVDGITYLSLIPNPNANGNANFNVKIEATEGSTINGDCSYVDGVYSGGSNGCTVSVTSGSANFVLY
ncbi:uncharacterized protein V1516DRAFT_237993 [Lipomyces oligophaga]|uniref:uncharacterized protein n=1 Tax=Lipomyces oligophaga TaxID=45792 RepID=UPI0034CE3105